MTDSLSPAPAGVPSPVLLAEGLSQRFHEGPLDVSVLQDLDLAVQAGQWPQAFELPAKVVMDPNAGGRVQAALAGRVVAGPKGQQASNIQPQA